MIQINYLDDMVKNLSNGGLTQELRDMLNDDSKFLSELSVENEQQRNLAFYLDHFYEDICEEFGYDVKNKNLILKSAFNYLKDLKDIDLTKIRAAILRSLRKTFKKNAYPNIMGVNETNSGPVRDVNKWVKSLREIYSAIQNGEDRKEAFGRITKEWDSMEKQDFDAWVRYYEKGNHEKYNVKTAEFIPESYSYEKKPEVIEDIPKRTTIEKTPEEVKKALLGRLNSAERLLYNFVNVWPKDVYSRLHQGLSDLKREIMIMRSASSMRDRIIRTASIWEKNGFYEGSNELKKIAQPPEDITSEIEKALSGKTFREDKTSKTPDMDSGLDTKTDLRMEPEMDPGLDMDLGMETLPQEEPAAPGGVSDLKKDITDVGPPEGVEEPLPSPEKPPGKDFKKEKGQENPFSGSTIQDVLDILQPLSQKLREREFIRSLSKADMMLDALNIASHFPELGEAQSKALELNIYVGTRVDKIIGKLKGGLKEEEDDAELDIDMGELDKMPEETAFEVEEEINPMEKLETKPETKPAEKPETKPAESKFPSLGK